MTAREQRSRLGRPAGHFRRKASSRRKPRTRLANGLIAELSTCYNDGHAIIRRHARLFEPFPTDRRQGKQAVGVADLEKAVRRIVRGSRPESIVRLLAAMAHPRRVRILLKLLGGTATHKLLAKATGLKAGPLYHHLRELRMAGLIGPKTRDVYVLTPAGGSAVLAALVVERLCR